MKRMITTVVLSSVVGIVLGLDPVAMRKPVVAQTRPASAREVPKFKVDPGWLKVPRSGYWIVSSRLSMRRSPGPAVPYSGAGREIARCAPGVGIRRGGQLPAGMGWSWTRVCLAHVGARHLRGPQRFCLDRRPGRGRSAPQVHERRKIRDANRPWWSQEDQPGQAESVEAGRCLRESKTDEPLRRRPVMATSASPSST